MEPSSDDITKFLSTMSVEKGLLYLLSTGAVGWAAVNLKNIVESISSVFGVVKSVFLFVYRMRQDYEKFEALLTTVEAMKAADERHNELFKKLFDYLQLDAQEPETLSELDENEVALILALRNRKKGEAQ